MLFYELMRWWYGPGWIQAWRNVIRWPSKISHTFSIPILMKTFFSPWHRIVTPAGASLESRFRSSVDNLVSRFIGTLVRFFVLLTAACLSALSFLAGILISLAWLFIPAAILVMLLLGIVHE